MNIMFLNHTISMKISFKFTRFALPDICLFNHVCDINLFKTKFDCKIFRRTYSGYYFEISFWKCDYR